MMIKVCLYRHLFLFINLFSVLPLYVHTRALLSLFSKTCYISNQVYAGHEFFVHKFTSFNCAVMTKIYFKI